MGATGTVSVHYTVVWHSLADYCLIISSLSGGSARYTLAEGGGKDGGRCRLNALDTSLKD